MKFFSDLFSVRSLVVSLKAFSVAVVFGVVYVLWLVLVSSLSVGYPRVASLVMLALFVTAFFLWGFLARTFWGWK